MLKLGADEQALFGWQWGRKGAENGNLKFLKLASGCVLVKPPTDRRKNKIERRGSRNDCIR